MRIAASVLFCAWLAALGACRTPTSAGALVTTRVVALRSSGARLEFTLEGGAVAPLSERLGRDDRTLAALVQHWARAEPLTLERRDGLIVGAPGALVTAVEPPPCGPGEPDIANHLQSVGSGPTAHIELSFQQHAALYRLEASRPDLAAQVAHWYASFRDDRAVPLCGPPSNPSLGPAR